MPRKFISFLGAIPYEPTRYYFDGDVADLAAPTPYVQEAIFEKVLSTWQPTDQVLIFTTDDAKQNNYHHRITRKEGLLENQGLEQILQRLSQQGRIGAFDAIPIANGNSEAEIWSVFQNVFQYIQPGDELYFDITYGFRSLPMLGMVLLDYARTIYQDQVKIQRIFYGNYEAGRALQKAGELVEAPVLDLTPFAELQQWTAAARAFLQGGNAEPLAAVTEPHNPEISRNLRLFAPAILTCRGLQLSMDMDISSFKTLVDSSLDSPIAVQLRPLLAAIQHKLAPFSSNNLRNGLAAVQWCIENGLVQQGYTFLQETIVSLVIEKVFSLDALMHTELRTDVGTALNNWLPSDPKLRIKINWEDYAAAFDYIQACTGLSTLYQKLTGKTGLRNDINHCGFKDRYAAPDKLTAELDRLYHQFLTIHFP
jgi:CRISPR-associated Csx2 family protein